MTNQKEELPDAELPSRWTLIRDIAVFQVKLLLDGFRDLLLVPVSLVVGIITIFKGGSRPGREFYELLRFGRHSERWINLFGAAEHWYGPSVDDEFFEAQDIDRMVTRVERFVVDEYSKGGLTTQAKERLDQALDSITRMAQRGKTKDE